MKRIKIQHHASLREEMRAIARGRSFCHPTTIGTSEKFRRSNMRAELIAQ